MTAVQNRTELAEQWPAPAEPQMVGIDPFFDAPSGFEDAPEGTVLRYRDVSIGFLGRIKQKVRATQLLYRTVNMHGEPEVTVTTVISPLRGAQPGAPLVSYQCAIDSLHPKTFPSYVLQHGVRCEDASFPQIEYLFIAAAVAKGWTVSVPDHGGQAGRWGIPASPATWCSTACAPRSRTSPSVSLPTPGSACGATPAAASPPPGRRRSHRRTPPS